ncbi:hypothetical protein E4634_19875 [Mangrovimicrobium sediminis]|uniref:Uncharacterized protein n=1 Tax=Mangrovimicrobium sediminis TaxID=2562682 RepID=A0A4Z0LV29_9GAMM|nr:hypothetical protein [Haliea sp. SAOS-164]TGD71104.1 hypothetical protein E4634_19875 [Haliea sp. SAOS-164]
MKTESEAKFEAYCDDKSVQWEKIEEGHGKSPDYFLTIGSQTVVAEVKQFNPNKDDIANYKKFKEKGFVVGDSTPGARVRGKITSAAPQIIALAKGRFPGVLILYSTVPLANILDPYHIKTAMYGLDTIVFSRPVSMSNRPELLERKSGPRKKLTEDHNTTISALAVLSDSENGVYLDIYHNAHAAIPLADEIFGDLGCRQYRIIEGGIDEFAGWSD